MTNASLMGFVLFVLVDTIYYNSVSFLEKSKMNFLNGDVCLYFFGNTNATKRLCWCRINREQDVVVWGHLIVYFVI